MSVNLEQAILEKIQALPDDKQQEVLALVDEMLEEDQKQPREKVGPIWEIITELSAQAPMEEWEKLPSDGAEQHDHYLYGSPKRISLRTLVSEIFADSFWRTITTSRRVWLAQGLSNHFSKIQNRFTTVSPV